MTLSVLCPVLAVGHPQAAVLAPARLAADVAAVAWADLAAESLAQALRAVRAVAWGGRGHHCMMRCLPRTLAAHSTGGNGVFRSCCYLLHLV